MNLSDELLILVGRLEAIKTRAASPEIKDPVERTKIAAEQIGKAWSGSWIGYQSLVYYDQLATPPPGAHFSSEWGRQRFDFGLDHGTSGDWAEYNFDDVATAVRELAGNPDFSQLEQLSKEARSTFDGTRAECLSILATALSLREDEYLKGIEDEVRKLVIVSAKDLVNHFSPKRVGSRDSLAMSQGLKTPPHLAVQIEAVALEQPIFTCALLERLVRQASSHLSRQESSRRPTAPGTKVFIGHGRSLLWRSLKDFVQDRLGLPWDEFNRVPVAGVTNIARLSEMLSEAAIALLVATAEDEQKDGKVQARMNVIHEAGLFQGKLGFSKAIVLLEEGCEEFSNIAGLGQIRFPQGKIEAAFEEVRRVLEREGMIEE